MTAIDAPIWVSIIGNFGFPIAITIYLFDLNESLGIQKK